ncbi:MAG: hypothetical protein ACKVVT_04870 [Dehalococcoidia bacterium]
MAITAFPLQPQVAGRLAAEISDLPGVTGVAVCDDEGSFVAGAGSIRANVDGPLAVFVARRADAMTEVDDLRGIGPAVASSTLDRVHVQGKSGAVVVIRRPGCLVLVACKDGSAIDLAGSSLERITSRYLAAA